ncbi:hypothetical protein, partial [Pseudomonas aeruginosa]
YHSQLTGQTAEHHTLRRYHRKTLQNLPIDDYSLAEDQKVLMWNRAIEELTTVRAQKHGGSKQSNITQP